MLTVLFIFIILLTLLRYSQTYLLMGTEELLYPVAGFVLSLLMIFPAWRVMTPKKSPELPKEEPPVEQPRYTQPDEFEAAPSVVSCEGVTLTMRAYVPEYAFII